MVNRCFVSLNIVISNRTCSICTSILGSDHFLHANGTVFCHLKTLVKRFEKLYFVLQVLLLYAKHDVKQRFTPSLRHWITFISMCVIIDAVIFATECVYVNKVPD